MLMPSLPIGNSAPQVSDSGSWLGQLELSVSQMPEKSGFPSGVRGVGADRLGFPSACSRNARRGVFQPLGNNRGRETESKAQGDCDRQRPNDGCTHACLQENFAIYGFFIAESQCSSAFPSLMRHMSNHVVV